MKKLLSIILALVIAFSFAACGKKTTEDALNTDVENNEVVVTRPNDEKYTRSIHGTTRALIANMVKGVSEGYEKVLEIALLAIMFCFAISLLNLTGYIFALMILAMLVLHGFKFRLSITDLLLLLFSVSLTFYYVHIYDFYEVKK